MTNRVNGATPADRRPLRRTLRRRIAGGAVALLPVVAGSVALAPSAHAASTTLCTGYAACNAAGYTSHGYNDITNQTMYWRAYAGHNCTNYAAYVETTVYKAPSPPGLMGNATDWGTNASAYGIGSVSATPTVGSVAWWNSTAGMSTSGHVAVVESVGAGTVTVSEDNWGGDFHWRVYPVAGITGFIRFGAQASAPSTPPPPSAPSTQPTPPSTPPSAPSPPAAPITTNEPNAAGVAAVKAAANGVNLYAVQASGGSSGTVQVTEASAATGYAATTGPITTELAATDTADWTYLVAPYNGDGAPDLYAVRLRGGASNRMEVHVLSAASLYRTFLAHIATAQPALPPSTDAQLQLSSYARDGREDLFVLEDGHTGSGRLEVHVLSAASGFSTFLTHRATALATGGSGWHFLVGDAAGQGDLVAIHDSGSTGSGRAEVHVLREQSGYASYALHAATPLPLGAGIVWRLGQPSGTGTPDLYVLLPAGASGRTELHTLSAASGYQAFSRHVATGLVPTPPASWELDLA